MPTLVVLGVLILFFINIPPELLDLAMGVALFFIIGFAGAALLPPVTLRSIALIFPALGFLVLVFPADLLSGLLILRICAIFARPFT
jgi:hypothetical protein